MGGAFQERPPLCARVFVQVGLRQKRGKQKPAQDTQKEDVRVRPVHAMTVHRVHAQRPGLSQPSPRGCAETRPVAVPQMDEVGKNEIDRVGVLDRPPVRVPDEVPLAELAGVAHLEIEHAMDDAFRSPRVAAGLQQRDGVLQALLADAQSAAVRIDRQVDATEVLVRIELPFAQSAGDPHQRAAPLLHGLNARGHGLIAPGVNGGSINCAIVARVLRSIAGYDAPSLHTILPSARSACRAEG